MRIAAGNLRDRVTLLEPVETRDPDSGEAIINYVARYTRWAERQRLQPTDMANEEQLIAKASGRLLMRLDSATRAVLPTWRVRVDGVDYEVVGCDPYKREGSVLVYFTGVQRT